MKNKDINVGDVIIVDPKQGGERGKEKYKGVVLKKDDEDSFYSFLVLSGSGYIFWVESKYVTKIDKSYPIITDIMKELRGD